MNTKIFEIMEVGEDSKHQIEEAASILRGGGLVAFPTETVYGLGADALNPQAVRRIFQAKGRPSDNPLIVHIASMDDVDKIAIKPSRDLDILAEKFWPGPLTMVVRKKENIPLVTTGGLDTVAIRMPDNQLALELIKATGRPLAAPSANISGHPSPTKGSHVIDDLYGRIEGIISSRDCKVGIESTVLDLTSPWPVILRPGMITPEAISQALGKKVVVGQSEENQPRSPGSKYVHYAPDAEMIILAGKDQAVKKEMERIVDRARVQGNKVGLLEFDGQSYEEIARNFFSSLRDLDAQGLDLIVAVGLDSKDPLGFALMNRMLKAAGYKVRQV